MTNAAPAPTYQSGGRSVAPAGAVSSDTARAAALQFLANMAAELSAGSVDLPCFPDVVLRIRNTLADPDTTPEKTVIVVGAEPRLAARLLQTANSAAFNSTGKRITDLRTAITRLGHQLVLSASMAFAMQQIKNEPTLRPMAQRLHALWQQSISVALIAQVVARRTKVLPDEAFLTGLMHGIGRLYIMVHCLDRDAPESDSESMFVEMISGWHASIGKSVLENWGFAEEIADAIGEQTDLDRRTRHDADLADVLIASIGLGEALLKPKPRTVAMAGVTAYQTIGLTEQDCATILTHAEYQLGSLQDALGC